MREGRSAGLRVSILDVGQGDAILLQPAHAPAVLVDGGPPGDDLVAKLHSAGVERLGVAVVTHEQSDHAGGIEEALGGIPIARLAYARLSRRLRGEAAAAGAEPVRLVAGGVLRSGRLRVEVLWPPPALLASPLAGADPNSQALVLLARWRSFSILLTADAEAGEVPIDPGPIDVLKVAHHGSEDPGLDALLDRTRPKLALISVGAGNSYGHPTAATLASLSAQRVPTLCTDRDGTIVLDVRRSSFEVEPRRLRPKRIVDPILGFPAPALVWPSPRPMDVLVLSSARKLLSRSILGSSLAGDGLLVRLRSTSIGLLGLVAAVGLGLIAFISQLGWPGVFSQPIPGSPSEAGSVHDAIALTRPAPVLGVSNATHVVSRAAVRRAVHGHRGGPAPGGAPAVGGSRQLAATARRDNHSRALRLPPCRFLPRNQRPSRLHRPAKPRASRRQRPPAAPARPPLRLQRSARRHPAALTSPGPMPRRRRGGTRPRSRSPMARARRRRVRRSQKAARRASPAKNAAADRRRRQNRRPHRPSPRLPPAAAPRRSTRIRRGEGRRRPRQVGLAPPLDSAGWPKPWHPST